MSETAAPLEEPRLSIRAYARQRGVNEASVRRAIRDGRLRRALRRSGPDPNEPPRIVASIADEEWREQTHPGQSRAASGGAGATSMAGSRPDEYRRALVLEKIVKAQLAQLELKEREGQLVRIDDVKTTVFEIARGCRNRLQELPARLAYEVAGETDPRRTEAILTREVREVLEQLATHVAREFGSAGSG